MAWVGYSTYPFTNDTGQKANGLHIGSTRILEIVSVNGKPPEGMGHGDYGVGGNGRRISISNIETAPGRTIRVRIKGSANIMLNMSNCYFTKDGKRLKATSRSTTGGVYARINPAART